METVHMGFKKKFIHTDFWNNISVIFMFSFILIVLFEAATAVVVLSVANFSAIFTKQDFIMPEYLLLAVMMLTVLIVILYFSRKFFRYELLKYNMPNGYNFVINPNGIELFVQGEESVFIDINEIDTINLSIYSSYLKYFLGFRSAYYVQSNLRKPIITIEVILKDDIDLTKFKRKGRYYRFFNFRVNKKTNQATVYLYEIMYDNQYKHEMVAFHKYFGGLIKTS